MRTDEAVDALADLGEAAGDGFVLAVEQAVDAASDLGEARRDALALVGQRAAQRFAGFRQAGLQGLALALDQRDHVAAADLEALGRFRTTRRDIAGKRLAGVLQQLVDGLDAAGERLGDLIAGLADGAGDILGAGGQALGEDGAGALQRARDLLGAAVEHVGEVAAGAGQALGDFAGGDLQALDEVVAAAADLLDHLLAGAAERLRDLVALGAERAGDAVAGLRDRVRDGAAGAVEVLGEPVMGAADGELDALGIADHGLALGDELVDQRSQADFVVGIGALQRRDLAADDGFQLAGARHGALDAVAHGGDLAADGLAERQDGIGAGDLRLGEAQRDLGHGARDQAHFLGAAIERREHEEEDDRRADREREQGPLADAEAGDGLGQAVAERAVAAEQDEGGAAEPGEGGERCEPVEPARRAHGEGLDERARIPAVVIGDAARIGRDRGARRRGLLLGGSGRRGRDRGRSRLDARQFELQVVLAGRGQPGLGLDRRLGAVLGLVQPKRLFDRRHRSFSGILELLGSIHRCRLATLLNMGAYGDRRCPMPPLAG